ncbi:cobalt-precorrin-6A reductase [Corynebacterium pseudotuberculosis]|uniref:Cobalt-precorrin-6A reductase n=1 Tax=Corynebacterium pseudotuberculosis (strain C231) TaxID=681645 RepID=D9QAC3_CORP2|nr:cobalt-precorrin-6A reductase [Corynebacterium pseudotuberculosis]ADK28820.1 cobalt-precorrin-6A reductase [Corynebacterium pseudotuberculosis FRC41]ADL10499.3 cobalt-precorrin-6A reductase [Corynebacterium pseudotuberculosis C231]ADL20908.3 cobalt-precorrin-6A reductase [Corynebacterium pseudotuberculosis 1002]ADO26296.3 cobalt-precorrin-6A reductase [Corynebacterium pseudotuberculosis I19]AEX39510.1 Precorrin-6A reductase [Corynebacterium pseudotuberculosis 3/99-5]
MRALILGGTGEAREVAQMLYDAGWHVTSSLAGRVANPKLPVGEVRIGGFGGPMGLTQWLIKEGVEVVIDATHPFAERISISAVEATRATGIPLIALHRPAWTAAPRDRWRTVSSVAQAASLAARDYHHIFLTIGRQQLAPFAEDPHNLYVVRTVEPPQVPLPPRHRLIMSRGPFTVTDEKKLMVDNQIDCVVTKNSGGPLTSAKLDAARELGVDVIMIQRPVLPPAAYTATSAAEVIDVLQAL